MRKQIIILILLLSSAFAHSSINLYLYPKEDKAFFNLNLRFVVDQIGYYLPASSLKIPIPNADNIKLRSNYELYYILKNNYIEFSTPIVEYGKPLEINVSGFIKNDRVYFNDFSFLKNPYFGYGFIDKTYIDYKKDLVGYFIVLKNSTVIVEEKPKCLNKTKVYQISCDFPAYFIFKDKYCPLISKDYGKYIISAANCSIKRIEDITDKYSKNINELSKIFNVSVDKLNIFEVDPRKMNPGKLAYIEYPNINFTAILLSEKDKTILQTLTHESVHAFLNQYFGVLTCNWFSEGNAEYFSYLLSSKFYNYSEEYKRRNNITKKYDLSTWQTATDNTIEIIEQEREKYDLSWKAMEEIYNKCGLKLLKCMKAIYIPDLGCNNIEKSIYLCCGDVSNIFEKYGISTKNRKYAKLEKVIKEYLRKYKETGIKFIDLNELDNENLEKIFEDRYSAYLKSKEIIKGCKNNISKKCINPMENRYSNLLKDYIKYPSLLINKTNNLCFSYKIIDNKVKYWKNKIKILNSTYNDKEIKKYFNEIYSKIDKCENFDDKKLKKLEHYSKFVKIPIVGKQIEKILKIILF